MNIGWTKQKHNAYVPDAADLNFAPIYDHAGHIGMMLIAAAPGDANFDGIVDVADLGMSAPTGSHHKQQAIHQPWPPEPTTLSLLAMSVLVIGRRRR